MEQFELCGQENCLYYVSSKCRTWTPAKTILVFAPDTAAKSISRLESFAKDSGWLEAGEADGTVVVFPLAPRGWDSEDIGRVKSLYKTVWRDTVSPDPRESLRNVWCWETLIFAVGYDAGAVYAGNAAVEHPNTFAQVAMINGVPNRYEGGDAISDRWLLPDASPEWNPKNKEVPVSVWFLGNEDTAQAEGYFIGDVKTTCGSFGPDRETTRMLMEEFSARIRWKNSPDGTPARLKTKALMDTDGEYVLDQVESGGYVYEYYTRLPKGIASAKGLPVVVSMHGHGEPAWMFAQKNGWPELQDETKAFVFVSPDSPEHTWMIERDEGMHRRMLDKLEADYGIDRSRVYLTGFSNGAMATCWYGTRHPKLYAALSPWNSPLVAFEEKLMEEGWEMPMFAINGDLDHKMDVPRRSYGKLFQNWITLNGGKPRKAEICKPWPWKYDAKWTGEEVYTKQAGYTQGHRLTTYVYQNLDGQSRFCFTDVKDMPHGAIADEARAAWNFMKRFSRPEGSKTIVDSGCDDPEPMFDRHTLPSGSRALVYVPTSGNSYTPSRSLVLIPRGEEARDEDAVKQWLRESGWLRQANRDGSVLLVPLSNGSWENRDLSLVKELYRACWGKNPEQRARQYTLAWGKQNDWKCLDVGSPVEHCWLR